MQMQVVTTLGIRKARPAEFVRLVSSPMLHKCTVRVRGVSIKISNVHALFVIPLPADMHILLQILDKEELEDLCRVCGKAVETNEGQ